MRLLRRHLVKPLFIGGVFVFMLGLVAAHLYVFIVGIGMMVLGLTLEGIDKW